MVKNSEAVTKQIGKLTESIKDALPDAPPAIIPNVGVSIQHGPKLVAHILAIYLQRKILQEKGKQELFQVKDLPKGSTQAQNEAIKQRLEFEAEDPDEQRLYERAYLGIDLPSVDKKLTSTSESSISGTGVKHRPNLPTIGYEEVAGKPMYALPKRYKKQKQPEWILEQSKIFKDSIPVSNFEMVSKVFSNMLGIELLLGGNDLGVIAGGVTLGYNLGDSMGQPTVFTGLYDVLTLASNTTGVVARGVEGTAGLVASIIRGEHNDKINKFLTEEIRYNSEKGFHQEERGK